MKKLFVSNKDESVRMFKSDVIEFLSKTHWTLPIIVFVPIIAFLLYNSHLPFFQTVMLIAAGLFFWSFTEYVLHRFVFHYEPKSEFGKRFHWLFHGVHHDYPNDSLRLVMPPGISLILGSAFFAMFYLILGEINCFSFAAGFFSGYLIYDINHYAMHHFAFKNKLMIQLKKHHMKHHFQEPERGFGVSSPLWDYVFDTVFQSKKKEN